MNNSLFDHFHPDEHPFVDKAWEWVQKADSRHETRLTDFLDPRQAYILQTLVNRVGHTSLHLDGGSEGAERARAVIAPDYLFVEQEEFRLAVLSVDAGKGAEQLEHGDYMGAILGLGIKRDKVGDIHVHANGCHCVVAEEISDYMRLHLQQVHRVHVQTEVIPVRQLRPTRIVLDEMDFTVASLRLDGIAGDVFRLSRAKALVPIKAGRCRVNWKVEEDPSKQLQAGDVVSMQGFGRFRVMEIEGVTKKGRIRLKIGKYR
ncbi:RNA-binding protein [Paenibacillus sp. J2TS4]|uniref:YlmH family RNA-binding protein n=1 Tax=Paenibacillus sp. J2TS4 TaxID=2807194 RepID=UPI001B163D4B|nr:YlmH/Sll1252 family protein [Paenibacillus sp. J2TS4]GIP36405.1 RNA-binding protein S4 [Paenibacillus sp. J2TS4]